MSTYRIGDDANDPERIAVALSGGGYRAAAFSAGVLLYLIDAGQSRSISAVSSVSGGSIANAYFARNVLLKTEPPDSHAWFTVLPLLAFLSRRDTISPARMLRFAGGLAVFSAASATLVLLALGASPLLTGSISLSSAAIALIVATTTLFFQLRRSLELAVEWLLLLGDQVPSQSMMPLAQLPSLRAAFSFRFRRAAARMAPRMTKLSEIAASYVPIFCCTDLATGSHFYIGTSFVAGVVPDIDQESLVNLTGSAPSYPVASAVAASAAFPAVFRPTVASASELGLPVRRGVVDKEIVMADGGLYDNFGVTFLEAWHNAEISQAVRADIGPPPDTLLVVDSGTNDYERRRHRNLAHTFVRSMQVVHQANSTARRQEIRRQFTSGLRHGAVIAIDDDPYTIIERCDDLERKRLASACLDAIGSDHGMTPPGWKALAVQRSPGIRTDLRKLGAEQVASLVIHGYAAAMARTVTELGWQPPTRVAVPECLADLCNETFVGGFWDRLVWVMSGGERGTRNARVPSKATRELLGLLALIPLVFLIAAAGLAAPSVVIYLWLNGTGPALLLADVVLTLLTGGMALVAIVVLAVFFSD